MRQVNSEGAPEYTVPKIRPAREDRSNAELLAVATGISITTWREELSEAGSLRNYLRQSSSFRAMRELVTRLFQEELESEPLTSPKAAGKYMQAKLGDKPFEVFGCLWLDNKHRVLAFEEMFRGTIDGATVPPREVVRDCMRHNAAAVIFVHNHPSGVADPSRADVQITKRLRDALRLIDVRVLDHLVVGHGYPVSMSEHGMI